MNVRRVLVSGFVITLLMFFSTNLSAQVSPVERRQAVLDRAASLTPPPRDLEALVGDGLYDPYFRIPIGISEDVDEPDERAVAATPREDSAVLEAIAGQIQPSGVMQLGNRFILLFSERQVRRGDFLTARFEGSDYQVRVTDIGSNHFTLQMNGQEFTKPISRR